MKIIRFANDFHETETTLIVGDDWTISARQLSSLKNRLCGNGACKCSGPDGARGAQDHGGKYYTIDCGYDENDEIVAVLLERG